MDEKILQIKPLNNPGLLEVFKKPAKTKEEVIERVERLVTRKISLKTKFLVDKAFELAAGIYILDERDPSKTKYYRKPPNLDAIIYLMDRLLGKPVMRQENSNDKAKKGVAELQNIIQVLAGGVVNINNEKDLEDGKRKLPDIES